MKKIDTYALAMDIVKWCKKNRCWMDITIYFDGKAWSTSENWSWSDNTRGKEIGYRLYEYANRNPKDYFSTVNEPNILSMSFEGELYSIIHGHRSGSTELRRQFADIFGKYGLYYSIGDAWNLTAYEKQEDDAMWDVWDF